ncbi:helicase associated domain-containing protein [Streptomyces sp. NBC_01537]|uniref:helicase associated domain-containing protein n=1 Tax=Streptomyces sp. NBC_01537 TaxID=2903896 RepID=UPI00386A2C34
MHEHDAAGDLGQEQRPVAVESALMQFSSPRDAATIAAFLRTRVYRPESLVWLEGFQALRRWRAENGIHGLYAVPYDTEVTLGVTVFPLGRWVHQQRRAYRAGELEDHRRLQLDEEGMIWEPGDEAWESKLASIRSFHRAHGHLAPRQDALWLDEPIGQHMANLRRKGGLGKDPERAEARAGQLAAIDPDWNCSWPLDWQRHYAVLRDLVAADGVLPDIQPGVLFEGDDIGRWTERQARDWHTLSQPQRERLSALGMEAAERPAVAPAAKGGQGVQACSQPCSHAVWRLSPRAVHRAGRRHPHPTRARGTAARRHPRQTRRIPQQPQEPPRQAHPRAARRVRGTGR